MQVYLTQQAMDVLSKICREMKVPRSVFLSKLIVEFSAEMEEPMHRCEFDSLGYYSHENLEAHIKRKHPEKVVIK